MKCYRTNCKKSCDEMKKLYCIFKITKEQHELIKKINPSKYCKKCGKETIKAKYKETEINLCTDCGVERR